jgi:transcriptional regulator with PAS, ATPase and Fis domain
VLITGESGSGKEIVARIIHAQSPREANPFVPVNCAAIPPELLESEMFGHERGAFTGAAGPRNGLFSSSNNGTIFLDEISEMIAPLQAKLLRVLEDGMVRAVGSDRSVRIDTRVIAATNTDLAAEVKKGRFREDLFYRLQVVPVTIPPLRERALTFLCWWSTFSAGLPNGIRGTHGP